MMIDSKSPSAVVRERLGHPVIDGDGHIVEVLPVLEDYVREIGGQKVLDRYLNTMTTAVLNYDGGPERVGGTKGWYGLSRQERRDLRVTRGSFWSFPASALDRATVMLPNLFRKRMDELGIDFAVLYPSVLGILRNSDDELRVSVCRALNTMNAELYGPHADRLTCAAAIPMYTPQEAIDELEYAVKKLGFNAAVFGTNVRRPIKAVAEQAPEVSSFATWLDVIALGSDYDYDPVWRKCVELGVAVTTHTNNIGWGPRTQPGSFIYNMIGHFAASAEAFCKALVIGGVVQRFPTLKFAFLEGGAGWACILYNDLIERWEKRNMKAMREHLDPSKLDRTELTKLFAEYGGEKIARKQIQMVSNNFGAEDPAELDEWAALQIDDPRKFKEFFENFYFGCEADDRMTAVAFDPKLNHFETRLQAIFSSDVGHWDVQDITTVVAEAYELVEKGLITEGDFRDFTFTNSARLHGGMNPRFFEGTAVEGAVAKLLRGA